MKKLYLVMVLAGVILTLSACGSGSEKRASDSREQTTGSSVAEEDNNKNDSADANTDNQKGKVLVAYFAYSENMKIPDNAETDAITSASLNDETSNKEGNLQVMAQVIEKKKGADVFHITMTEPYEMNYSDMLPRATEELKKEDWPALKEKVPDLDKYSVVYLGTPVWNAELPPAIHTFLAENDLSEKKIVLFGIHLGSQLGRMDAQLKELVPDAELEDSYTVSANTANDSVRKEFEEWLK